MVLQGLEVPVWVGWLGGMLFFKFPWGIPRHDSWLEPIFIYQSTLTVISHLLWFDYIFNYSEEFGGDIYIRQVITKVFTYLAVIFSTYLRICFAAQAKKTATFLQRIEQHPIFMAVSNSNGNPTAEDQTEIRVIHKTDKTILMWVLIMNSIAAAAFSAAISQERKRYNSWFSGMGTLEYAVTFFLFATLPMAISIHIAFSFAVVITKYLIFIFEEFCNSFERTIGFGWRVDDVHAQDEDYSAGLAMDLLFQNKGDLMTINYKKQLRDGLWSHFDLVTSLFQTYDDVAGSYLLGLVIITIMFFVQTINAILIFDLSPLFLAFDWFTLICLLAQLVLILFNLGHSAHRTIAERKMSLRRHIGGMTNNFEKDKLAEIADLVMFWDWKMSAWGFFTIDRTLMPGVVSIMLSYIVILFQLQHNTTNQKCCLMEKNATSLYLRGKG